MDGVTQFPKMIDVPLLEYIDSNLIEINTFSLFMSSFSLCNIFATSENISSSLKKFNVGGKISTNDFRSTAHKSLASLLASYTTSSISEKCLFNKLNGVNVS